MLQTETTQLETVWDYMKRFSTELGQRILQDFPALQQVGDPLSPLLDQLLRRPKPAQAIAIMALVKHWRLARTAKIVAECGTGKTLMSLGAIHVHSEGKAYNALAMAPPHLVEKWAREAFLTIPGVRVFLIDDLRTGGDEKSPHGVNEVRLRRGLIVREGFKTTLTDLRLRKHYRSAQARWRDICSSPALFIIGRDRAKLGYFWRHAYLVPGAGPYSGCVVNPESGKPVFINEQRLTAGDFDEVRIAETIDGLSGKSCRSRHSALWQADADKIRRMAPVEFIGRYLPDFFDYAICDEIHQLAGDTAQGNALGVLASCTSRSVGLTGTLLGGYADELYNTLYRMQAHRLKAKGYEWGAAGRRAFCEDYGVLEKITRIKPAENACSDAKVSISVRRKPGASPLLFGEYLMDRCAFVFLEDISEDLPSYEESVINVPMDEPMRRAYEKLEADIREALKKHKGNRSVLSIMLNALLLYPDRPYGLGTLYGRELDRATGRTEKFVIAETRDLPEEFVYSKERNLVEEIKSNLAEGRKCHVFAVYTQKRDVTARLEKILTQEGIRTAVLRSNVPTEKREAWYARRSKEGVQVVIGHPKLVETGLDLLEFPTLLFYESGYSLHTLRQASRRSWRIGQRKPVRVKFFSYENTMQGTCLRLMGKKLLVALALEGKFAGEGLQSMDEDDDMLTAMARELVERNGIGESADAIWRDLNLEHQRLVPTRENNDAPEAEPEDLLLPQPTAEGSPHGPIEEALGSCGVLVFGQRPECSRPVRRRAKPVAPEQTTLFQ